MSDSTYAQRKAAGRCGRCGGEVEAGDTNCAPCRAHLAEAARNARIRKKEDERQARGVCVQCESPDVEAGEIRCAGCLAASRELARLAARCGKCDAPVPEGESHCKPCQSKIKQLERMKRLYAHRRSLGLCTWCGQEAMRGRSMCWRHGWRKSIRKDPDRAASRARKTYRKARAAGLCVNCRINPPRAGRVQCQVCADIQKVNRLRREFGGRNQSDKNMARYYDRKGRGQCVKCQAPAKPDKAMCAACGQAHSDRQRERRRNNYRANRAAGLCGDCGKDPRPGFALCQQCSDSKTAAKRRRRESAKMGKP